MTSTALRTLNNYVGGEWVPSESADTLEVTNPANGEVLAHVPLSSAADLDAAVDAARAALPEWRAVSTIARARKLFELREGLEARKEELARSVTTEMGKTIVDARAEVGADDRDGRGRVRDPDRRCRVGAGGRRAGRRRGDDPPAGRRVRRDRAVQLPGDGPVLVPAVRDRVRQRVHPQAVRAGAADAADRVRGARLDRAAAGRRQPRQRRHARSSRGSSSTRGSTRSRSSARRRSRRSSTRARRGRASACRLSAARRTTSS